MLRVGDTVVVVLIRHFPPLKSLKGYTSLGPYSPFVFVALPFSSSKRGTPISSCSRHFDTPLLPLQVPKRGTLISSCSRHFDAPLLPCPQVPTVAHLFKAVVVILIRHFFPLTKSQKGVHLFQAVVVTLIRPFFPLIKSRKGVHLFIVVPVVIMIRYFPPLSSYQKGYTSLEPQPCFEHTYMIAKTA